MFALWIEQRLARHGSQASREREPQGWVTSTDVSEGEMEGFSCPASPKSPLPSAHTLPVGCFAEGLHCSQVSALPFTAFALGCLMASDPSLWCRSIPGKEDMGKDSDRLLRSPFDLPWRLQNSPFVPSPGLGPALGSSTDLRSGRVTHFAKCPGAGLFYSAPVQNGLMPSWRAFRSRLWESWKGDQQSGFTVLVNELGNANRTNVCLFEARLLVAGSGAHGSGHMCHPRVGMQPSAGVRGRLCLQKEWDLQLERSCTGGRVGASILEEQPGCLGCDS